MKQALLCLLISVVAAVSLCAQDSDLLGQDSTVDSHIRRKANGEIIMGITSAAYTYQATLRGEPIPNGDLTVTRIAFSVGIGGHIPLTDLGPLTTLWLVPAVIASANIGKSDLSNSEAPAGFFDLSVPIHVTLGYGALRRKSAAFGLDGGIGVTFARRFAHDAFTLSPSAMIDLSYSPKAIFHLRFMVDVLPGSLGENKSYRTWSISVVGGAAN